MNKFILAITAAVAVLFGFGAPASAQYGGEAGQATVSPGSTSPGGTVTVTFTGCTPGETVTFILVDATATATCRADGTAVASLPAPMAPGSYTGTATGSQSNVTASFVVVVLAAVTPPGGLPATGSGGVSATTSIAAGLLAMGVGLFGVAQYRRRRVVVA